MPSSSSASAPSFWLRNYDLQDVFDPNNNNSSNNDINNNDINNINEHHDDNDNDEDNSIINEFDLDFDFDDNEQIIEEKKEVEVEIKKKAASNSNSNSNSNYTNNSTENSSSKFMVMQKMRTAASASSASSASSVSSVSASASASASTSHNINHAHEAAMTASVSVVDTVTTNNNNNSNKINEKEEKKEEDIEEMTQMMFDLWGSKETTKFNNTMADTIAAYVKLTSGSNASVWNTSDETVSNTLAIEVNKVWAKELYDMTKHPDEYEAITDEMHGVKSRSIKETTDLISKSLLAMEYKLLGGGSSSSASSSYDMDMFILASTKNNVEEEEEKEKESRRKAVTLNDELKRGHIYGTTILKSNYITSNEFRLKFLRCEFFDITKACIRYCKNLNLVYELFGDIALLRPLQINDLSKREIQHLKVGQSQVLTVRDKMGRRMFVGTNQFDYSKQITIQEFSRVTVYLAFGIMEDEETSAKEGAVHVNFLALNSKIMTISWDRQFKDRNEFYQKLIESTSARYTAIHVNMPDTKLYHFLKSIILSMMPSAYRAITRIHTGSTLECNYSMCSFGIPTHSMCITSAGKTKNKAFLQTLRARNAIDEYRKQRCRILNVHYVTQEMEKNFSMEQLQLLKDSNIPTICPGTDCPDMNCIILGDRRMYKRSANIEFRYFLQLKRQQEDAKERPRSLDIDFLDEIIDEAYILKGYKFVAYDTKYCWYATINASRCDRGNHNENHRIKLRKKISQLMRDERKRTLKAPSTLPPPAAAAAAAAAKPIKRNITYDYYGDSGNNSLSSFGIDPKRFKPDCPDCLSSCLEYNNVQVRDI